MFAPKSALKFVMKFALKSVMTLAPAFSLTHMGAHYGTPPPPKVPL